MTGLFVANALPFRHRREGGTRLIIGGHGFHGYDLQVTLDRNECRIQSASGSEIPCLVPKASEDSTSVDLRVSSNGIESVSKNAVLYLSR